MIKFSLVAFLKANAGVSALVGSRVYPRRLPNQTVLPALALHQISEFRTTAHSGEVLLTVTRIQIDVRAKTDFEVETIKKAITDELHCFVGAMGGDYVKSCFLEEGGDLFDEEMIELDDFGGSLDFIITWK